MAKILEDLPTPNQSRQESYLGVIAGQEGAEMPEKPQSREEEYLEYIAEHGGGGGGEPAAYLKSITKDETNKTINITDKQGNETEFPYGGGVPSGSELPTTAQNGDWFCLTEHILWGGDFEQDDAKLKGLYRYEDGIWNLFAQTGYADGYWHYDEVFSIIPNEGHGFDERIWLPRIDGALYRDITDGPDYAPLYKYNSVPEEYEKEFGNTFSRIDDLQYAYVYIEDSTEVDNVKIPDLDTVDKIQEIGKRLSKYGIYSIIMPIEYRETYWTGVGYMEDYDGGVSTYTITNGSVYVEYRIDGDNNILTPKVYKEAETDVFEFTYSDGTTENRKLIRGA